MAESSTIKEHLQQAPPWITTTIRAHSLHSLNHLHNFQYNDTHQISPCVNLIWDACKIVYCSSCVLFVVLYSSVPFLVRAVYSYRRLIAYCVVVLSVYRSSLVRFIADCVCCLFVGGLLALSCGRLKAQVGRLPCPSSYLSSLPLKKTFNQSGH